MLRVNTEVDAGAPDPSEAGAPRVAHDGDQLARVDAREPDRAPFDLRAAAGTGYFPSSRSQAYSTDENSAPDADYICSECGIGERLVTCAYLESRCGAWECSRNEVHVNPGTGRRGCTCFSGMFIREPNYERRDAESSATSVSGAEPRAATYHR